MTYDFYVLLKFITQHKFNIKLPVDNNGKEKQLALFTINNPELDELKKLPKAPTAKTINTNDTNNAEQKPKRTRAKKNVELPPVVNNQEPQAENIQNEPQEEPQGENQNDNQNEPQEEPEEENNQNEEEINLDGINFDEI